MQKEGRRAQEETLDLQLEAHSSTSLLPLNARRILMLLRKLHRASIVPGPPSSMTRPDLWFEMTSPDSIMRAVLGRARRANTEMQVGAGSRFQKRPSVQKVILKCVIYTLGTFFIGGTDKSTKIRLSSSEVLFFQPVSALEMMTLVKLMCCWVTFKRLRVL